MQAPIPAVALSAWADRLDVVDKLVSLLNRAAEQQQQQVVRRSAAEMVQLLQQHLHTVLLPLLCTPTADDAAVLTGGAVWSAFYKVLSNFCVTDDNTSSPAPSFLLDAVCSPTAGSLEQQQQQLFGLLVSVTKAAGYTSQLPRTPVV
jgi:hypothetical protein